MTKHADRRLRHASSVMSAATDLIKRTEQRRRSVTERLEGKRHRAHLGQFFTPAPVADFLAELLDLPQGGTLRVIDPGAGVGSLTAALVARVLRDRPELRLEVVAFELDDELEPYLAETLADCEKTAAGLSVRVATELRREDFVAWAAETVSSSLLAQAGMFDACLMNPPYRKVNNGGADRLALERVGLPVTNLYAAFLALAADLLEPGGQLSAITPRSFANGVYFKPFRQFFLARMSFDRLHLYEHRGLVFADSQVLQENVVFRATRRPPGSTVTLSSSVSDRDSPLFRRVPYVDVVRPDDPELIIRIPVDDDSSLVAEEIARLPARLGDLGIAVSTGRVVDFRAREHLRLDPTPDSVPLIYPGHLRDGRVVWPQPGFKKPNALAVNERTAALLLPNETYVVVKRFTAKEERRRVVASLVTPEDLPCEHVAFENHLNVYHACGRGIPRDLAKGLVAFLNSRLVDRYIRQISGHTQINAADLRQIRYPSVESLGKLARAAESEDLNDDEALNTLVPSVGVSLETVGTR